MAEQSFTRKQQYSGALQHSALALTAQDRWSERHDFTNQLVMLSTYAYLPTTPFGQDMTQGQFFLAKIYRFEFRVFILLDLLPH